MVEKVLKILTNSKRPLNFGEIAQRLSLTKKEKKVLKKTLRTLVKQGRIIRNRKGRYGLVEEMPLVRGYFDAHKNGYGFVVPETGQGPDIFIPPWATMGAIEGDRVIARVENVRKREGRIIRILERAFQRVVGRLRKKVGLWFVEPKRPEMSQQIIYVKKSGLRAREGDLVQVEITSWGGPSEPATGRLKKVLKEPTTAKEEMELIIDEFDLPRRFPPSVTKESSQMRMPSLRSITRQRRDLRGLRTVTIDGETAKDFDDAVSIEKTPEGYRLFVHIADVSFFVKRASQTDKEALKRATSVYLPDRAIPMLPKALSEDLCSLKPKVPRLTFTLEMLFSDKGERIEVKYYPSVIVSDERMTYTTVATLLEGGPPELRARYDYLLQDFELMAALTTQLRKRRLERGSLDFDLPEPEVVLDLRGEPEGILVAERNFAHMIIEEFMIAANEAVAEFLYERGVPSLYRVHPPPDEESLKEVRKLLRASMGFKGKTLKSQDLPEVVNRVKGTELEDIVHYVILRSLKQARYSPDNIGHFGLASGCYTHFTSPIRRYPDLVVHRILKDVLQGKEPEVDEEDLMEWALHCSKRERFADEVESSAVQAMRAWFMRDKLGEVFEAKVVSVGPFGIKVRLKDYFVDGYIHVSTMLDDYYIFDEEHLVLTGKRTKRRFGIGSSVRVLVERVDLVEREVVFSLAD
ncbi:MAG: ribonuclease R [Nitrospirae bacterium]|nr:MAG: ribonuclease R [Nitrospirota bacterium]